MVDLINHPFIKELEKFEFVDGNLQTVKINGVKEVNSEEGYLYSIIRPLHNKFLVTDLHNHITYAIKAGNNAVVRNELSLLKSKIELIVKERDTDLTIRGWRTELSSIDLKDYKNRERYHVLKFLIGVTKVQKSFAIQTVGEIDQILLNLTLGVNDNSISKPLEEEIVEVKPLRFVLTKTYTKLKNRTVLTDLRNDLIDKGYLSKDDPNNTLANFKKLFTSKEDVDTDAQILPLRWIRNQTELKYFIYIITNVLIEPNYTPQSNYYVAFNVFMNKNGNPFKPAEFRYKEKPATFDKMDMLIRSLDLRDTSN